MITKKEIAVDFLKLASKGDSRKAFNLYASTEFRHHNAFFRGDAETFIQAIEESARENPDKVFEIQRALEDGDLVAIHSKVRQNPNDPDLALMHIFRFETGKIVELWDFGQAVPSEMVNEYGMF